MKKNKEQKNIFAVTEKRNGKLVAIASDETVDRAGDKLGIGSWNLTNFKKNPVLQAGHDYRPQYTIGIAENIRVEGKKLVFEPKFHDITELARDISKMFDEGFLKAWSVGFIPGFNEGDKNELLEVSAVAVPANPNALTSIKGMADDSEPVMKIKSWVDGEKSQMENGTVSDSESEEGNGGPKEETPVTEEVTEEETEVTEVDVEVKEVKLKEITEDLVGEHFDLMKEDINTAIDLHKGHIIDMGKEEKKKEVKAKDLSGIGRWNKSLSEAFDIDVPDNNPSSFQYKIYSDILKCKVKDIYINSKFIFSTLLGTNLSAVEKVLEKYELIDTRNFEYNGTESPVDYETIQLNSKTSKDFLVDGVNFYKDSEGKGFAVKFSPGYMGISMSLISTTEKRSWAKELMDEIEKVAEENNYMKGEKFALNGEFLEKSEDSWDNLFMVEERKDVIKKVSNLITKQGKDFSARGLLFVGPPGTGKTKTGRVLLNSIDSTFIWVSSKDFYWIGASEGLRMAFKLARQLAPSVLFIEDIDKSLESEYSVDLLKTEMDGIRQNKGIVTILTSNNPEKLPDALLDRPGRFHDVLNFDLPEDSVRKEILKSLSGIDSDEEFISTISKEMEGYSASHIKELVDFAKILVDDEGLEMKEAIVKSLEKLKRQRELIADIRKEKSFTNEIVEKEGRVISKKNKKIISEAKDSLNKTVQILDGLLEMTDSGEIDEKKEVTSETIVKEVKNAGKKDVEFEITKKILQKISKETNDALRVLKKK